MYHTQIIPTIFCPQWRSQGSIHFPSLFFVWQDRCEEFLHQMQWVRHNHFPCSSEKARDLVSCFGRNIIRIMYSTEMDTYIKLRCGCKQTPRWEMCGDRSLGKEGGKQSPHIVHSKTETTRWRDTERAPARCGRTAAIRGVLASQAVKIYSQVQLLFPTLIKSINVFHFSRNCEVIHQLIMY